MADIDPSIMRGFEAELNAGRITMQQFASSVAAMSASINASSNRASSLAKSLADAQAGSRAQGAAAAQLSQALRDAAQRTRTGGAEAVAAYRRTVEEVTASMGTNNPTLLRNVKRYADAQLDAAERAETYGRIISGVGSASRSISSGFGQVFSAATNSAGDVSAAGKVLEIGLMMAGRAASTIGAGIQAVGTGMMTASGITGIGAVVSGLTVGLGAVVSALGTSAKEIAQTVPTLVGEMNKYIAVFQSLSSSGAIFSNGLQGMISTAGRAGITLGQLDEVVKTNKEIFAQLGDGVTGGVNAMANVLQMGGVKFRTNLMNLGYSVQEQAGLVAETMRGMKQSGKALGTDPATTAMIGEQTQKYAENLRIIAQITGEDAKKKSDEARQAATALAFQQKIDALGPEQKLAAEKVMMTMNAREKQMYMEYVVNGQAMTQGSAILAQQVPALAEMMAELAERVNSGNIALGDDLRARQKYSGAIGEQIKGANRSIGLVGMGAGPGNPLIQELSQGMGEILQNNQRMTTEAIENALKRLQGQEFPRADLEPENGGNAIQKNLVDLMGTNQDISVQMQKLLLNTGVINTTMDAMNWAARQFTKVLEDLAVAVRRGFEFFGFDRTTGPRPTPGMGWGPRPSHPNTPPNPQIQRQNFPGPNTGGNPLIQPASFNPNANNANPNAGASALQQRLASLSAEQRKAMLDSLVSYTQEQRREFLRRFSGGNRDIERSVIEQLAAGGPIPPELAGLVPNNRSNTNRTPSATEAIDPLLQQARLYHEGRPMPTGEELAAQREEEQRRRDEAAEREDQEQGSIMRQNLQRNLMEEQARRNNGMLDPTLLEKISTTMLELKNAADESLLHLRQIESNTKQTAINVI